MSTPAPAQPANQKPPSAIKKEPAHYLVDAHASLCTATGELAEIIQKLSKENPNPNHIKTLLQDVIKSTADAGKILTQTDPKFKV